MSEGLRLHGRVEQLLPGGEALVRNASGVLLAPNGVPGDEVEVEAVERRRGAVRGRIVTVLEPSPQRVLASCEAAAECGGCSLQYVRTSAHADIKSDWVSRQFEPFMNKYCEWLPVMGKPAPGMRRRVRWHRGHDADGSYLGFHARGSHRVVRSGHCPVVNADMDALRLALGPLLPPQIVSVRMLRLVDGMHVLFEAGEDHDLVPEALAPCLSVIAESSVTVQPWLRAGVRLVPLVRPVRELHDRLPSGDSWVELVVGAEDFVQGHAAGNEAMLRQIQAWGDRPRRIVDLFCGIGNLSLPLAAACGAEVSGAEVVESSIRQARSNAAALGVTSGFEVRNLFEGLPVEHYAGADLLLLDPPRKGARAVCRLMGRLFPKKIIMINCDIASGARDAEVLAGQGYRMTALRALDLFPFSGHVEAMSCWEF